MNQAETIPERVIYENQEFGISISGKTLTVGEEVYTLRSISAVTTSTKKPPLWPGVILLLWGVGVFLNDSLPSTLGVAANHPLFKYAIFIAGGVWFGFRSNAQKKFDVHVRIDGNDIRIARCGDQMEAVEILTQIDNAL